MAKSSINSEVQYKAAAQGAINLDEAKGIVECFVAGIGNKDSVGDVCAPGAFAKSLMRRKPRVVWGHNWNDPIGKVLEIYEVPPNDPRLPGKMKSAGIGGLYARVQFNLLSEKGREAFASVAFFGEEQEWSIGYKTINAKFDQQMQANVLYEVELYEVSPVLHGANQLTGTISVKSDSVAEMEVPTGNAELKEVISALKAIASNISESEKCGPGMPTARPGAAPMQGPGMPSGPAPRSVVKPERPSIPENPLIVSLRRELVARTGSNVIVRSATDNTVVFDRVTSDGMSATYRIAYHFQDGEFMFGKPEKVVTQTVYTTESNPSSGDAYWGDDASEMPKSLFLDDISTSSVATNALMNVIENLQQMIDEKSEYFIPVKPEEAFEFKQTIDPVLDYYRAEARVTEEGIVVKSAFNPELIEALDVATKSVLGKIRRGIGAGRRIDAPRIGGSGKGKRIGGQIREATGGMAGNLDPSKISLVDPDGDGWAREGSKSPVWVGFKKAINNLRGVNAPGGKGKDTKPGDERKTPAPAKAAQKLPKSISRAEKAKRIAPAKISAQRVEQIRAAKRSSADVAEKAKRKTSAIKATRDPLENAYESMLDGFSSGESKKPRYPRKPTYGPFLGDADEFFQAESWEEFKEKYAGKEIVFLDYETTGLVFDEWGNSTSNGAPVQLGAVKVKDGKIVDRINLFMDPKEKLGQWSLDNLKDADGKPLTDEWLSQQMSIEDAHKRLVEFAGPEAIFGAQNTVFDKDVLDGILDGMGEEWRPSGWLDTRAIAALALPKWSKENPDGPKAKNSKGEIGPSSSLKAITEYLGVELGDGHHNADVDAMVLDEVMRKIIDGAIENGWSTDVLDKGTRDSIWQGELDAFDAEVAEFEKAKQAYIESQGAPDAGTGFSSGKENLRRYITNPYSKAGDELEADLDKYGEPEILDDSELDNVVQSYAKEIAEKKSALDAAIKNLSDGGETPDKWRQVLTAEENYDSAIQRGRVYAQEATDRKRISREEGFSSGADKERRHAKIGTFPDFDLPEEVAERAEHDMYAADFKSKNGFWVDIPRAGTMGPVDAPEDWYRGREIGYNASLLYWDGDDVNPRPKKFDPKARQSVYYMDWYENLVSKLGNMLDMEESGDNSPEKISGIKAGVLELLAMKRPTPGTPEAQERLAKTLADYGFGPGGRHETPFSGARKSNVSGFSSGAKKIDKKTLGQMLDDGKSINDDDVVAVLMPNKGILVHRDMRDEGDEETSFVSALQKSSESVNQNIGNAKAMIRMDEDGFERFRDALEGVGGEFTPAPYNGSSDAKYPYVWGKAALSSGKNAPDDEGVYPDEIEDQIYGESQYFEGSKIADRINTGYVDMEIIPAAEIGIDDEGPWTVVGIHRTEDDNISYQYDPATFATVEDATKWIEAYSRNIENDIYPGDESFNLPDELRMSSGRKRKERTTITLDDGVKEAYDKAARERARKFGFDRNTDPSRPPVAPVQIILNDRKSGRFGKGKSRFSSGSNPEARKAQLKQHRVSEAYIGRERASILMRRMDGLTVDDVAEQEGVSRSHIRQLEMRELARLRESGTDNDVLIYRMGIHDRAGLSISETARMFDLPIDEIRRRELRAIEAMRRKGRSGDLAILEAYEKGLFFDDLERLTGIDRKELKARADRALRLEIDKADAKAVIFDEYLGKSGVFAKRSDEEIAEELGLGPKAVAAVREEILKELIDTENDIVDYYSSLPEMTDEEMEEMARYYGESLDTLDFLEDPDGFSSGRKGRGRKNKPLGKSKQRQWTEEDRRNFADRNILKSRKRPGKRKDGPSAEEFSSGRRRVDTTGSSALTGGYYDPDTERLVIGFDNGGVYVYDGVSPEDAADLHNADSKGRAMAALKKKYAGKRLSSVDERFAKTTDGDDVSVSPDSDTEYLISKSDDAFYVSRMTGSYSRDGGQGGSEYYHPEAFKSEDSAMKWIEQDYLVEDMPDPWDERDDIDALSSGARPVRAAVQMQVDTRKSRKASKMAYSPDTEEVEVTYNDGKMRRFSNVPYDEIRAAANPSKNIDDFIDDLESGRAGRDAGSFSSGKMPPRTNYDYSKEAFEPTEEQKVVADAVATGEDVVVRAFAGTGKTSTLTLIARRFSAEDKDKKKKRRIIYIAFNKGIQTEAEGKFPNNTETRTSDSIAWQWASETLGDAFMKKMRLKVNKGEGAPNVLRSRKDIQTHFKIKGMDHPDGAVDGEGKVQKLEDTTVTKMVQEAVKQFAISADDEIGPQHFKSINNVPKELIAHANAMWADMNDKKGKMILDFEHITKMWALTRPQLSEMKGIGLQEKPDVIFFDEAQDINPVMAKVMADQGIQIVYVGDSYQAIYGFRGATDTLQNVEAEYDLPLTNSWRFGPEVQEIANRYLSFMGSKTFVRGRGKPGELLDSGSMDDADAILTRTNAGALKAIVQELENGRTVGASSRFKNDIKKFVRHALALKKGESPKEEHPELAEFETWQEVLDALSTEGEASQKLQMLVQLMSDTPNILSLLDRVVEDAVPRSKAGQKVPGLSIPEIVDGSKGSYPGKAIDGWSNNPVNYLYKDGYLYIEPPFNRKNTSGHSKTWDWFRTNMPGNEKGPYGVLGKKRDGQDKWGVRKKMSPDEAAELIGRLTTGEAAQNPVVDVIVQTAHTSKGLEYGKVKIFQDWRTPKLNKETGEWEFPTPEDQRLAYVAVTRAQSQLDPGPLDWIFKHTDEVGDPDSLSSGAAIRNKMPTHIGNDAVFYRGSGEDSIFNDTYVMDFNGGKMVIQPAGRDNWAVYRADLGDGSSGVPEYGFSYGPPDDDAEFSSLDDAYNHVIEYAKKNNLSISPLSEDGKTKGNDSLGMARISNEDSSIAQGFSSGRENAKTRVEAAYGAPETRRGASRGEFVEVGTSGNRRDRRLSSGRDTTSIDYRLDMLRGDTKKRILVSTDRPIINKDSIVPKDRAMEIINDPLNKYNAETGWPISLNRLIESLRFNIDTSDMVDEDGQLDGDKYKKALAGKIASLFEASTNVDRSRGLSRQEIDDIVDKLLKGKDKNGNYADEVFIDSAAAVSIIDPFGSRGEEHLDSWFGFDARPVWVTRDDAFDPTDELKTGKQQWTPLTREQFNSELDAGIPPEAVYQHPYAWFNESSDTGEDSRTWGFGDPRTTEPVNVQSDKGKAEVERTSRANSGGDKGVVSPGTSKELMLSISPGGDAEITMTQFARMLGMETEGRTVALKGEMAREMAEKLGMPDVEALKTALRYQPKTPDGVPIVPLHLILNARRAGLMGSFEEAAKLANNPRFSDAAKELDRRVFVGTAISRIKKALESVGKYKEGEYENLWRGKKLIGELSSPDFVSVRTEKPFRGQSKFTGAEFLSEDDMRAIIDKINAEYDADLSFDSLFEKDEQGRIKDNFSTPEFSSGASGAETGRRFVAAERPDRMAGASADTAEMRGLSSGATKPIYRNQSGGIDHVAMSRDIDGAFRGPSNGRAGITEENAATVGRDQMNNLEAAVNLRQEIADMFPDVVNDRTATTLDVEPRLIDQGVPAAEAEKIADRLVELDKYIAGIVDQFDEEAEKLQGSLRQVDSMLADLDNLRKTRAKMVADYGEEDSVNVVSRLDDQISKLSDAAEKLYDETVNSQLSDMAKLRDEATDLVDKNPGFVQPKSETRALSSGANSLSARLIATELAMGRSVDGQMPKYKPISKWDWDYPEGTRLSAGRADEWYANLTAKMIEMIEKSQQEGGKWEAPWHRTVALPRNGISKHQFAGGNAWWLMFAAEEKGYTSPVWATYNQWASVGGQVRKGEKSTYILRPNFKKFKTEDGKEETRLTGWSAYPVFNIDQIDGINKEEYTGAPVDKMDEAQRVELAEKAFAALGATIKTGDGSSAHYSPSKDEVVMPPFGYFKTPEGYYATLGHELVHWTGHSSRMDRPNMNGFGTQAYAREELVAELGAAFLLAHFGLAAEPREDHAHYLASWLKALREEPDALQKAAQEAQKAVKFLIEQMQDVLKEAGLAEDGLDSTAADTEEKSIWGGIGWQLTKSSIDPLALPQHLVELANFAVENYDQKTAEKTVNRISKTLNFLESLSRNKGNR